MIRSVHLPDGTAVPALGQGTWKMGERAEKRRNEIASLQLGVELGMTVIDTAEMYGEGRTESLVGEALRGLRNEVFLVSKVYPHNAAGPALAEACEASLRRLGTDRIDLYLLHWMGSHPLEDTIAGFEVLQAAGKIRYWGVSNLDTADMQELVTLTGGEACATDQVLYNLVRRGPEFDLLPWLAGRAMPAMAYSPIEQGGLPRSEPLAAVARRHGATPTQIALAFVLRLPGVIAIPKAGNPAHVRENRQAADIILDDADLAILDAAFPPPRRKRPLAMI